MPDEADDVVSSPPLMAERSSPAVSPCLEEARHDTTYLTGRRGSIWRLGTEESPVE